ncbi:hypothetical protein ASG36_07130 [Geodermatophilus sp. Leaf369]|uniref:FAD-dependent oxidoreductase n=1 Tax=Geodermatophilus sp. Leaf369 TaxID=1736354 RepID=UPI0006FD0D8B|nr:GMC family oxidoreductase [Geodermatophilus sp. Leaf369]KQS60652.1 hypothetical protein ASG36_07130 [Geodermatophilus sp. Leaf369]
MIIDLDTAGQVALGRLDPQATLVVGGGAAGLAVALGLEDRGRPVVLLESGGDPRDVEAQAASSKLNVGQVSGAPYRGLEGGRARVLGGATQLWHGQCTRLRDSDLAVRPWVPGSGWPLGPSDLEPWYTAAEAWFGLSGRGYDAERWAEHRSVSPIPWSPDKLQADFSEYTITPHLGSKHRRRLTRSSTVTTVQHATVVGVLVEEQRAVGVRLRDRSGAEVELRGGRVVLAAGAIENARILMLSDPEGIGLGTGRGVTGRYLQDHPVVETLEIHPTRRSWLQDRTSHLHRGRRRLYPKVRLSRAAQEGSRLVAANAVLVHEHDDPGLEAVRRLLGSAVARTRPESLRRDVVRAVGSVPAVARTAYRRWVRGLSAGRPSSSVRLQIWLEQVPDRESRVTLGAASDPLGLPVADVRWRLADQEIETSRVFSRWVADDLRSAGLAEVTELPAMVDDAAWRAQVVDAYHPAGTTRMSVDPAEGVVDTDSRVHGLDGLFVAGSSVFPIAGYANPTLTIVALSLRLAHHLAGLPARR